LSRPKWERKQVEPAARRTQIRRIETSTSPPNGVPQDSSKAALGVIHDAVRIGLHFDRADDSYAAAEKIIGLESGRLAMPANVLSSQSAKPVRTWFVATAKLKQPIRTAIIEDDPALRKMIVSLLQADPDYAVVAEFAEGGAAIAAIPQMALDIALVDIGLPDISGIEVIRELKALCPACNVLVVTTFGDEKTVTSALEAGADGYLLKGIALEELKRDLHALQDGGSPLSPMIARKLLNRLQTKAVVDKSDAGGETSLTPREHEILEMIAKGFSYAETSKICSISTATVHSHLKRIYRKLEVHSKTEAVYEARRRSLIH
jgi:DNA-binding NarL/FixJ family response regulator